MYVVGVVPHPDSVFPLPARERSPLLFYSPPYKGGVGRVTLKLAVSMKINELFRRMSVYKGNDGDTSMGDIDVALMSRFRDGDASAFDELIERHKRPLCNFFYKFFNFSNGIINIKSIFLNAYYTMCCIILLVMYIV